MDQENIKKEVVAGVKKNKKLITIIVIVAVLVIAVSVNSFVARKIGERRAEKILEDQFGGKVDINSQNGSVSVKSDKGDFSVGEIAKWPTDMPTDIPEFTYGKLKMSATVSTGWQILATGVSEENFTAYNSSLKSLGWSNVGTFNANLGMVQMTKGNYNLITILNSQNGNFTLTVSKK